MALFACSLPFVGVVVAVVFVIVVIVVVVVVALGGTGVDAVDAVDGAARVVVCSTLLVFRDVHESTADTRVRACRMLCALLGTLGWVRLCSLVLGRSDYRSHLQVRYLWSSAECCTLLARLCVNILVLEDQTVTSDGRVTWVEP